MIAKVTIEEIERIRTKTVDGVEQPLTYLNKKTNKQMAYTRLKLKGKVEGVSRRISAVDFDGWTKDFKVGDTVKGKLEEKTWNDNKFWELSPLRKLDELEMRIEKCEQLIEELKGPKKDVPSNTAEDLPWEDV